MAKKFDTSKLAAKKPVVRKSAPVEPDKTVIKKINNPVPKKEKIFRTTIDFPESVHMELKMLAVKEKTSMKELILKYIAEGMKK